MSQPCRRYVTVMSPLCRGYVAVMSRHCHTHATNQSHDLRPGRPRHQGKPAFIRISPCALAGRINRSSAKSCRSPTATCHSHPKLAFQRVSNIESGCLFALPVKSFRIFPPGLCIKGKRHFSQHSSEGENPYVHQQENRLGRRIGFGICGFCASGRAFLHKPVGCH